MPPGDAYLAADRDHRRRQVGLVALGGGAVGAAVMGVLALGVAPADAPVNDRRAPASITQPGAAGPDDDRADARRVRRSAAR